MSNTPSPRELAELTLRRLNRACHDLGLTLKGRPLFVLEVFDLGDGAEVYDIELNTTEFEDYPELATTLEKLAESLGDAKKASYAPRRAVPLGQQKLPGMEDL